MRNLRGMLRHRRIDLPSELTYHLICRDNLSFIGFAIDWSTSYSFFEQMVKGKWWSKRWEYCHSDAVKKRRLFYL